MQEQCFAMWTQATRLLKTTALFKQRGLYSHSHVYCVAFSAHPNYFHTSFPHSLPKPPKPSSSSVSSLKSIFSIKPQNPPKPTTETTLTQIFLQNEQQEPTLSTPAAADIDADADAAAAADYKEEEDDDSMKLYEDVEQVFRLVVNSPSYEAMAGVLQKCKVSLNPTLAERVMNKIRFSDYDASKAIWFFEWLGKIPGYSHSVGEYEHILFLFARLRDFNKVWELLRHMKALHPDLITSKCIEVVFARLVRISSLELIFQKFDNLESIIGGPPGVEAFNGFLQALSHYKNAQLIKTAYHSLKSRFEVNTQTFNVILGWCRGSAEARQLFDEMRQAGCIPDVQSYNSLVRALCRDKKVDEIYGVIDEMKIKRRDPDIHTYSLLIEGLGNLGRHKDAYKVLEMMEEDGHPPHSAAYNALINNLCKAGRYEEACKMLREMESNKIPPTPKTYHSFIYLHSRRGLWEKVWSVYLRMIDTKCYPRNHTLLILMRLFCKHSRLDMALHLWDDMIDKGFGFYPLILDVIICHLCNKGKLEDAERCFFQTIDKGQKPSLFAYNRLRVLLELTKKENSLRLLSEKAHCIHRIPTRPTRSRC